MALINILARLGIDSTSYNAGLKKAESAASAAGRLMKNHLAQAFTVAAIGKLTHDVVSLAGKIKDSAEQFNLTRKEVQELMRVADDSGLSFEQLAQSVNKVTDARAKAAGGEDRYAKAFETLGLSMDKVGSAGVRSADILRDIADALARGGDNLAIQGAAIDILGVKSAKMFEALKGINQMGEIIIISDDQIDRIDKAGKILSHAKDDLLKMAAGQFSEAIEDYHKTVANFGGGKLAQAAAGPASAIAGLLNFFTSGFRKDGNTSEGRLDLEAALAARAGKISPASSEVDAAAAVASAAVGKMTGGGGGSGVSDPLAKIGGLFFGADAGMRAIPQRQLDELRRLNARVERIERAATAD